MTTTAAPFSKTRCVQWLALCLLLTTAGCHTSASPRLDDPRINVETRNALRGAVPIFDADGNPATWADVLTSADGAEVIVVGEQHNDATGHAIQLALLEDALQRWPDTALSMEMLDRSEQAVVDDYVAEIIDRKKFLREISPVSFRVLTKSYLDGDIAREAFAARMLGLGWPEWPENYQPMIDAAREAKAPVVAANTPWLRYSKLANKEGFERLDELTPAQRALVEVPEELPSGRYRERFWEVLAGRAEGEEPEDTEEQSDAAHPAISDEDIIGMYRAQCVMDATMADSIADHLNDTGGRVIHLVGQFHSDFEGGVVQQLRGLRPGIRITTISMQAAQSDTLRDEDRERADFVVYTGNEED